MQVKLTALIKKQRSSDLIKIYEEKRKETSANSQATKYNSFFQIVSPGNRFSPHKMPT